MNKLLAIAIFALLGVLLLSGCTVTKVNYERNDKGEVSYRLYRNDHWLKTESTGLQGGMTKDGKFEFKAEGMKSSPSEEFNRTMQTYTTAFVQLAQIAAAAYNPSASSAIQSAASKDSAAATPKASSATQSAISDRAASSSTSPAISERAASSATPAISERAASAAKDCPGGSCPTPVNICTGAPLTGAAKDCPGGSCTDQPADASLVGASDCPGGTCTDTNK